MANSWELTEEQKKEINEKNKELAAQYDPVTGKKKNTENTGDDEMIEPREREREDNIR